MRIVFVLCPSAEGQREWLHPGGEYRWLHVDTGFGHTVLMRGRLKLSVATQMAQRIVSDHQIRPPTITDVTAS